MKNKLLKISFVASILMLLTVAVRAEIVPAPPDFSHNEFLSEATKVKSNIESSSFNEATCKPYLASVVKAVDDFDIAQADRLKMVGQSKNILDVMWGIRLALHNKISTDKLSASCVDSIKATYRTMRAVEDYLGEYIYPNIKQIRAESIDFKKQPVPLQDQTTYPPFHLNPMYAGQPFEFKSGDIFITKGVSFLSSTISTIPDVTSQYSHIVFIQVDEKTKAVSSLESYVGPGFSKFTIEDALRDENARIMVLRPKNAELGKRAADFMMGIYNQSKARGEKIPYDYKLDFVDHNALTCAEVAEWGYEHETNGQMILPQFPSKISLNAPKFLSAIGLKKGNIFTPIDMETDPRFEMVLEWRDQRLMRDSRYKDAVAHSMLRWMNKLGYSLRVPFKLWTQTEFIDVMRRSDLTWKFAKSIGGSDISDAIRDIPLDTLRTMGTLKLAAGILLNKIYALDAQKIKADKWPMTNIELEKALDKFRADDFVKYVEGETKGSFHKLFRPKLEGDPE